MIDDFDFDCKGFWDGNLFCCGAIGSEDCDWECPHGRFVGYEQSQIEQMLADEMAFAENEANQ